LPGAQAEGSSRAVVKRLLTQYRGALAAALAVITAGAVANSVGTYMTSYAKTILHMPESTSIAATLMLGVASLIFCLVGGWLADVFGRRLVMIVPRVLLVLIAYPAYYIMVHAPSVWTIFAATGLISALSSICSSAGIVAIPESFPRAVRSAGLAISYAFSVSIFGGTAQLVITWLIKVTHDPLSPAYYLLAASLPGVIAPFFMKETAAAPLLD
jgi:MFS family permease